MKLKGIIQQTYDLKLRMSKTHILDVFMQKKNIVTWEMRKAYTYQRQQSHNHFKNHYLYKLPFLSYIVQLLASMRSKWPATHQQR